MVSLDLLDTCLRVPVHPLSRRFLLFCRGVGIFPFMALVGPSSTPQVFTRVMAPVSSFMHRSGVRFLPYLGGWLVLGSSFQGIVRLTTGRASLLRRAASTAFAFSSSGDVLLVVPCPGGRLRMRTLQFTSPFLSACLLFLPWSLGFHLATGFFCGAPSSTIFSSESVSASLLQPCCFPRTPQTRVGELLWVLSFFRSCALLTLSCFRSFTANS